MSGISLPDMGSIAMAEKSPLVRQWLLLRMLCSRRFGVTVREMAEETGVGQKTIRRDLETFLAAGFPLEGKTVERGLKQWRLDPAKAQPGLSFTFDEAVALYLGRHLLEPLAGTPFWSAAQQAFRKIRASLGEHALDYVERFRAMFHQTTVGTSDYSAKGEVIDQLMIGIEDRRAVFITYQSLRATEPVTYDVYPYGLTYHRGSLYLVGRSPESQEIRHWKVDRMDDADLTPVVFDRPKGFDLHSHMARSFGVFHGDGQVRVEVRFAPEVARYVQEKSWHPTQQLTTEKDGHLLAQFDLDTTEEIKRWILSFGRHAEVLRPEELRREIADELKSLAGAYGTRTPSKSRGR